MKSRDIVRSGRVSKSPGSQCVLVEENKKQVVGVKVHCKCEIQ